MMRLKPLLIISFTLCWDWSTAVRKKGLGLMLGPQFVKMATAGDKLHLEAWTKFAVLPGWYVGEMGIKGFIAAVPKKKLRKRIQAIEELVTRS